MIDELLARYPLISDQVDKREVRLVLEAVAQTAGQKGDVVEFGCYAGTTSLFISRWLKMTADKRQLFVYDSFEGLPEKANKDMSVVGDQFVRGELAVSKKQFILNYKKAGLQMPIIHKGWFEETPPSALPTSISCAFLDGDYYESIMAPLKLIWPRLAPGAVVVVDDYANEALPGAARAINEWLLSHPAKLRVEHSLAILTQ